MMPYRCYQPSIWVAALTLAASSYPLYGLEFREQELPTRLGVGYAVKLVDVDADRRPDILIVDQDRVLWLGNPNWDEHVILQGQSKRDNVCFAEHDIDQDGRLDLALGADWNPSNTASGGTIQWLRNPGQLGNMWTVHPIGEEPTTHRMQFADLDGVGGAELVVVPLHGRGNRGPDFEGNGVRILAYPIPHDPVRGPWEPRVIHDELHVCHNFQPTDLNQDGRLDLVVVSFEGVHWLERGMGPGWRRTRIGTGNQQTSPNRGASEVKRGRLAGGRDYLATIEPWHGKQVVVYHRPSGDRPAAGDWFWERQVLDEELQWGHAVWCANLDQDEDEELVIGVRDDLSPQARRGLRIYDPREGGREWSRQVIDPGSVAIEDLAVADLNGDGRSDIVAVGRQTHNVKIYWNETRDR